MRKALSKIRSIFFCTLLYVFYLTYSLNLNAGFIGESCHELFPKNKLYQKKCIKHAEFFDTKSDFINKCRERFKEDEDRMLCLRSGAEITIFRICNSLSWDDKSTLSCLRYYPTEKLKKECLKFSQNQEAQLRCLKEGRESDRVKVCRIKYDKEEERLTCLTADLYPAE